MCALFLLLSWAPLLRRVGADSAGDPRVLPLVALLAAVAPLLLAPVTNLVSRHVEARADLHALDLTGDGAPAIATEHRLATTNLSDLDPNPVVYALFFTHPSAPERIALAREWERLNR
jgi:STE24 endopeptidase